MPSHVFTDAQHRGQRRTTRVTSRQTVAENGPSTKPGVTRAATSKTRTGSAGLSIAKPPDPNVHGNGTSSKSAKPAISKDTGASSAVAPVKRKREALSENIGAKAVRPKAPVVVDKENQQVKKSSAYVEVPSIAAAATSRVRTTTTATTSRITTSAAGVTRSSRIVVKRDEEVAPKSVQEEPSAEPSLPPSVSEDDAMLIDDSEAPTRSARHPSTRSSVAAHTQSHAVPRKASTSVKRSTSTSSRSNRRLKQEDVDHLDVEHVSKKRRTSSVGPDEKPTILQDQEQPTVLKEHLEEAHANALIEEVKWEDLDKEDEADPLMVSEYVVEIFDYLRKLEIQTLPNPHYIDIQKDLAWKMRGILMDWLIQVHGRFRLLPETLFLAVNIIDRFLSTRVVSLVRLQLVGITAMFIASKYEEILSPSLAHFMACSDSTYTETDILDAEKYILRSIDYNLGYPNPINFLRRSSKADGYDLQVRTVAKYLIEIACVDWRLLPYPPSQIAAAGMWFARLILEKDEWVSVLGRICLVPNLISFL